MTTSAEVLETADVGDAHDHGTTTASGRLVKRIGAQGETVNGVFYKNCNILDFEGERFIFSHRAIFTVVVVSSCNAGCKFCSNEITFTPAGPPLQWSPTLARTKEFALLAGVRKIAYTGGEPTLNPQKLYELMRKMNPGFTKSRLHTNGFGLLREVGSADGRLPLIEALIGTGLSGISVSVAHFEPDRNRQIMVLPKSWPGMTPEALSAVAGYRTSGFTPRLSCVMTAEGVNDVAGIFSYMEWGRALGFRRFIFRSCSEIPDGFKKASEFTAYNDQNLLRIDGLSQEIAARPGVEQIFSQRKSDSKVDVYRWGDVTFDIDESSEEPDPDEKIRRLNIMPNGVTYTSWIDPLAVLFKDELATASKSMRREFGRPVPVQLGRPNREA